MKTAHAALFAIIAASVSPAAQQAPAAPTAGESPYRAAARLPVRITSFAVEPTSIQPGQSVTLSWAVENPTSTSIDPLGHVAPRGRRTLTPGVTTTYTLAVTGAGNTADKRTVTVVVAGTMPGASPSDVSAAGGKRAAPRTADGRPDLSGLWQIQGPYIGDISRDLKPGELSFQPWAAELYAHRRETLSKEDPTGRCMVGGVPRSTAVPYPFKILNTTGMVVILYEAVHSYRQIFTDGRELPKDPNPHWFGYSVGW